MYAAVLAPDPPADQRVPLYAASGILAAPIPAEMARRLTPGSYTESQPDRALVLQGLQRHQ